jgi:hypothetical protein
MLNILCRQGKEIELETFGSDSSKPATTKNDQDTDIQLTVSFHHASNCDDIRVSFAPPFVSRRGTPFRCGPLLLSEMRPCNQQVLIKTPIRFHGYPEPVRRNRY